MYHSLFKKKDARCDASVDSVVGVDIACVPIAAAVVLLMT